jgi:hypothetical protein
MSVLPALSAVRIIGVRRGGPSGTRRLLCHARGASSAGAGGSLTSEDLAGFERGLNDQKHRGRGFAVVSINIEPADNDRPARAIAEREIDALVGR